MRWVALLSNCLLIAAGPACSREPRSPAPATRLPEPRRAAAWDWNGVIGTGQSLSVGAEGPPRSTEASYHNLKLDLGGRYFPAREPTSSRLSLVALTEPIRPLARSYPGPYPRNIYGETPHTAMASQITALVRREMGAGSEYVSVHSVVGESGQDLRTIGKGAVPTTDTGHAFQASLFETRAISRLAREAGRTFGVSAVVLTHGEADAIAPDYAGGVVQLWRDYAAELPRITGQSALPWLLVSQQASCPVEPGTVALSAFAVLEACAQEPLGILCTGPRYQYEYDDDAVHLRAEGYVRLGEKYGQAYYEQLVKGSAFRALAPLGAQRAPGAVHVRFHVPVSPLVWDAHLPPPHTSGIVAWAAGRGFELSSRGRPVTITSVAIEADGVVLRHGEVDGAPLVVRYAATATDTPRPGGTRRWGLLRDSDPFVGALSGTAQPNYAVSFELPVAE